ncbi:MAG: hypothetical protein KAR20_12640, partial [Candidatus Heimdallarchaeota archaeon]|nr:hypothetical protein [Candidatus Heimdallarchaeota archaeon]
LTVNITTALHQEEHYVALDLDDPSVEYSLIYFVEAGGPLFDVILDFNTQTVIQGENVEVIITLINVGEPGLVNASLIYTLYLDGVALWQQLDDLTVLGQLAFNKTITTSNLEPGIYTYEVVHSYGDNQSASGIGIFTVEEKPSEGIPWFIILIILAIIIFTVLFIMHKKEWIDLRELTRYFDRSGQQPRTVPYRSYESTDDDNVDQYEEEIDSEIDKSVNEKDSNVEREVDKKIQP